jgi:hypothetical protein
MRLYGGFLTLSKIQRRFQRRFIFEIAAAIARQTAVRLDHSTRPSKAQPFQVGSRSHKLSVRINLD